MSGDPSRTFAPLCPPTRLAYVFITTATGAAPTLLNSNVAPLSRRAATGATIAVSAATEGAEVAEATVAAVLVESGAVAAALGAALLMSAPCTTVLSAPGSLFGSGFCGNRNCIPKKTTRANVTAMTSRLLSINQYELRGPGRSRPAERDDISEYAVSPANHLSWHRTCR